MASATFSITLPHTVPIPKHYTQRLTDHHRLALRSFSPSRRRHFCLKSKGSSSTTYISGPGADVIISENDPEFQDSESESESQQSTNLISWGLIWSLVARHKLRLAASVITLVGCTTCILTLPLYIGRYFEVLTGVRPEPLWKVLSKMGLLYTLEPIFTIIFVSNMNTIWEKVMLSLRAQIFRRVLIQKVEFFDRYKVGELTALLTSELGSLKNIVSENTSRDRGFRALSEVVGTISLLFVLSPPLAPILCLLTLTVSVLVAVYKRSTVSVYKAHGLSQASIADCVNETFSAIRTVRSFGGEKHQMSMFGSQVLAYQTSGIKLGIFKSVNESLTRVAVYISLMALYCLGGSKVKAGELSVGTVIAFIGYTFTLTFAVQALVNTFGDLSGAFAATDRINAVLSGAEIDEALACGLEKEIKEKEVHDKHLGMFFDNGSYRKRQSLKVGHMWSLNSASNVHSLAESGDICLEGITK
ncbi:unnamed protein product [Ilex paraguariensis]|uniref:ABC transmembrane type-1 domain-containing protein n=1 Tax=Ilex paraguariensis TaxID=185542 RepID=A0ABC8QSL1_9AQUA